MTIHVIFESDYDMHATIAAFDNRTDAEETCTWLIEYGAEQMASYRRTKLNDPTPFPELYASWRAWGEARYAVEEITTTTVDEFKTAFMASYRT